MKIQGQLVDIITVICPGLYGKSVFFDYVKKILYVQVLKEVYGMLISAILFYKKFRKYLEITGFKFNPCDPCEINKIMHGRLLT